MRAPGGAANPPGDGTLTWTSPAGRRYASAPENAITTGRLTAATVAALAPGTDLDLDLDLDELDGLPPF